MYNTFLSFCFKFDIIFAKYIEFNIWIRYITCVFGRNIQSLILFIQNKDERIYSEHSKKSDVQEDPYLDDMNM